MCPALTDDFMVYPKLWVFRYFCEFLIGILPLIYQEMNDDVPPKVLKKNLLRYYWGHLI